MHCSLRQTSPPPHEAPSPGGVPAAQTFATQVSAPSQAFPLSQSASISQKPVTQLPLRHCPSAPPRSQIVPFSAFPPPMHLKVSRSQLPSSTHSFALSHSASATHSGTMHSIPSSSTRQISPASPQEAP